MVFNYLKIGIVVIALSALIAVPILISKLREAKQQLRETVAFVDNKDQEIEYYKNQMEREMAKKNASVLAFNVLKDLRDTERLGFLKEFEGLKKNLKNLEVATNINTKTISNLQGNLSDTTVLIDSIATPAFTFNIEDQWVSHRGEVVPVLKKITIISEVNVPIQGVIYWERPKLFGFGPRWFTRKQYKTEITSPNPYTKITEADQILVRKRGK